MKCIRAYRVDSESSSFADILNKLCSWYVMCFLFLRLLDFLED